MLTLLSIRWLPFIVSLRRLLSGKSWVCPTIIDNGEGTFPIIPGSGCQGTEWMRSSGWQTWISPPETDVGRALHSLGDAWSSDIIRAVSDVPPL